MIAEDIFEAFGGIDNTLIQIAESTPSKRKVPLWIKLAGAAAALSILFLCIFPPSGYWITVKNGEFYIKLRNSSAYNASSGDYGGMQVAHSVIFDSVSEMKSDLIFGNFTDKERWAISHMERDEFGRIRIPNLTDLYEPTYPSSFKHYKISWDGDFYTFSIRTSNEDDFSQFYATVQQCTEKAYLSYRDQTLNFQGTKNTIVKCKEYDSTRNATIYYTGSKKNSYIAKQIHYEITNGNKTFYVQEHYLHPDETIPSHIKLYGTENDVFFYAYIQGFTEIPTVEWLSAFGLKKYAS